MGFSGEGCCNAHGRHGASRLKDVNVVVLVVDVVGGVDVGGDGVVDAVVVLICLSVLRCFLGLEF